MTMLKVCGIREGDSLNFTASRLVSHIGFIFVPESRRFVTAHAANRIVQRMAADCTAVGVFVNQKADDVARTAFEAGIRTVQLHGQESVDTCRQVRREDLQVWKAIQVGQQVDPVDIANEILAYAGEVDGVLLDAAPPKAAGTVSGGHGVQFEWSLLPQVFERVGPRKGALDVWVAGGLTPENLHALLETFIPDGIDVSSGVEVGGRKSPDRIQEMIEAVNRHGSFAELP